MKTQRFIANALALWLLPIVGFAAPVQTASPTKTQASAKEFKVVLRAVRIHVAAEGTKTTEVIGNTVASGTVGIRLHAQVESLQYNATPRVNADNSVDLRLAVAPVKSFARNDKTFIYSDAVRSTSKMQPNRPVQFAGICETEDPQVIAAMENRTPLPTTGAAYSVVLLFATGVYVPR